MPTAYKGKLRISCKREVCSKDPVRADAAENCFACPEAACEILDLDDRVLLAVGVLDASVPETTEEKEPETVAEKGKRKR